MKIVKTDPDNFQIGNNRISFAIYPVDTPVDTEDNIPAILIGKNSLGDEVIISETIDNGPDYPLRLSQKFGALKQKQVEEDLSENYWALFLRNVLQSRNFFPAALKMTADAIREQLELGSHAHYSKKAALFAEMELTKQEILAAIADYRISI